MSNAARDAVVGDSIKSKNLVETEISLCRISDVISTEADITMSLRFELINSLQDEIK